jgi:hypothetical protein
MSNHYSKQGTMNNEIANQFLKYVYKDLMNSEGKLLFSPSVKIFWQLKQNKVAYPIKKKIATLLFDLLTTCG